MQSGTVYDRDPAVHSRALVLTVVLAACGGEPKRGSVSRGSNAPKVEPVPTGPAKPLDASAFGTVPARMPGAIGRLRTGMAIEEVRGFATWLAPADGATPATAESGYSGMRYVVHADAGGTAIGRVIVDLPDDGSAAALVTQAWGAGAAQTCDGAPCTVWIDPEQHARATLLDPARGGDLELSTFLTPPELLTELAQTIGAAIDHLALSHPAAVVSTSDAGQVVSFPSIFGSGAGTPVTFTVRGGKVAGAQAVVEIADDAERTQMLDAIIAGFGKAVGRGPGEQGTMWLDPARGLRLVAGDPEGRGVLALTFTPFRRLEDLLGVAKDQLAFETTPILGKTKAELAQSYVFEGDTITLPGTEHSSATVITLVFDADDKVQGYSLPLSTRDDQDPRARDHIKAMLTKKFGKGTGYVHTGLIYRKADPRIVARLEPGDAWTLIVGTVPGVAPGPPGGGSGSGSHAVQ